MSAIRGKDVLLEVKRGDVYEAYACADNVEITFSPEVVDTTTVSSGRGVTRKVRRLDWSISVQGVTHISSSPSGWQIFDTIKLNNIFGGYDIRLTFSDQEGREAIFLGNVVLAGASITGPDGFSDYTTEFVGNGAYSFGVKLSSGFDYVFDFLTE